MDTATSTATTKGQRILPTSSQSHTTPPAPPTTRAATKHSLHTTTTTTNNNNNNSCTTTTSSSSSCWPSAASSCCSTACTTCCCSGSSSNTPTPTPMSLDVATLSAPQRVAHFVDTMGLSGAWRISASDFDTITSRAGVTHTDALRALLPQARTLSVAPISNFNVGAAVLGASGNVYLGANNEHTRVSIAACVHAEQCALANTFLGHEEAVRAIAITAMPCGHCRQFINELPNAKDITILVDNHDPLKFEALLPHSFGPSDLHADPIHFLSHPRTPLRVLAAPTVVPGSGKDADAAVAPKAAVESAVAAAEASYSPHTLSHAGLVLVIGDKHVRGSYVENCAFNPSLPPLQMALINARMQQLDCRAAEAVVLAEREHEVAVSHVDATLALMRSVGIRAPLTHVQLQCRGDGESGHARQRDCDGADGDKSEESRSPGTTSDEGPSRGEEGDQTQG